MADVEISYNNSVIVSISGSGAVSVSGSNTQQLTVYAGALREE